MGTRMTKLGFSWEALLRWNCTRAFGNRYTHNTLNVTFEEYSSKPIVRLYSKAALTRVLHTVPKENQTDGHNAR